MSFVQLGILFLIPWGVLALTPHIKLFSWLGPVTICYALGILWGNLDFLPLSQSTSTQITEFSIPLAIPLLLYSTNLRSSLKLAKTSLLSFALLCFSVCLTSFVMSYFFRNELNDIWKLAGMMVGVYTGGTPNLTAIGMALSVGEKDFVLLNMADLIVGGSFFLFLLTAGIKLSAKFLPAFINPEILTGHNQNEEKFSVWKNKLHIIFYLLLTLVGVLLSVGLSQILFSKLSTPFIILGITSWGIFCSSFSQLSSRPGSYEMGNYLLLVFCVAMGSLANLNQIFSESFTYLYYAAFITWISAFLHLLGCWLFKIDRDTAMVTAVAGLFGPVFIGPVVAQLNNKKVLVTGISIGLLGYALGNYLGLALAYLTRSFLSQ